MSTCDTRSGTCLPEPAARPLTHADALAFLLASVESPSMQDQRTTSRKQKGASLAHCEQVKCGRSNLSVRCGSFLDSVGRLQYNAVSFVMMVRY